MKVIERRKIMKITEAKVTLIKPSDNLLAIGSCVIDGNVYLGSIGIATSLTGDLKLVFPTKKIGNRHFNIYHPINKEFADDIRTALLDKYHSIAT